MREYKFTLQDEKNGKFVVIVRGKSNLTDAITQLRECFPTDDKLQNILIDNCFNEML